MAHMKICFGEKGDYIIIRMQSIIKAKVLCKILNKQKNKIKIKKQKYCIKPDDVTWSWVRKGREFFQENMTFK